MDIKNYYVEKGSGTPLLLLHGNNENGGYFVHQIDAFCGTYRVIAIDTRGHGKTERGTAPFTIRQFAEDLKCFMDEHNIDKAHILGFSDGANIAMCFALKYPERVMKLILNGGNLNTKGVKPSLQIPIEIGYRISKLLKRKNAEMLSLMVDQPNISADELKKITADTLVIAGTKDVIKQSHTEFIAKNIANAKLCIIDGDHCVANKSFKEFNRIVADFLNED